MRQPASDSSPLSREEQRLDALYALDILDSKPEAIFDEAVQIAAEVCGTPIAAINLLDRDRQWFKAKVGLSSEEEPRTHAFCNYLIDQNDLFLIPDAAADARFETNTFVHGEFGLRFYAGIPLNTASGFTLGSLCVINSVPQTLDQGQKQALKALGRQVATQIELRARLKQLQSTIKEKERIERDLRGRTVLFETFMENFPAIGFIKDIEGRFIYYNQMFCERFAVSATEWINKSVFDIFPLEFATAYHEADMAILASGVPQVIEETSPGPAESILYWRTHKFPIKQEGDTNLLGGLCLDVSSERNTVLRLQSLHAKLQAANVKLTELSVTDGLTGLLNRRAFDECLHQQLKSGADFCLVLLDLDHFKALNDTFGHSYGDEVLKTVATLLKAACRSADSVARFGGEEFAVLLSCGDQETALEIAERMRAGIEQYPWTKRAVQASFGLCASSACPREAGLIVAEADGALYRAKQTGRNRVCLPAPESTCLSAEPMPQTINELEPCELGR